MEPRAARIVKQSIARRKPAKERGTIRPRTWKDSAGNPSSAFQADFGTVNGKRLRKLCDTRVEAENWLRQQRINMTNQGLAAFTLADADRIDAIRARSELATLPTLSGAAPLETVARIFRECFELLDGTGGRIQDAVRFYVKHHPQAGIRRTLVEVANEYLADAVEHNLRPMSIKDIRARTAKFCEAYPDKDIAAITSEDADAWARRRPDLSPTSRKHNRIVLHGLFQFAIDRGYYAAENPFSSKRHRRTFHEDEKMPECLTCADADKLLQAALKDDPSIVPGLAIGFFAGVRPAELAQLDWKDIDFENRRITILPAVAKKRRARHVTIEDNLAAWLAPYRQVTGLIAPDGEKWKHRLGRIRESVKVKWPHNALRHSFASHHLVKFGDPQKTAFQLGHGRDVTMLFEHYRSMVTKEDAERYFEIRPAVESKIVEFKTA